MCVCFYALPSISRVTLALGTNLAAIEHFTTRDYVRKRTFFSLSVLKGFTSTASNCEA